jgi:hypothetical protein
MPNQFSKYRDDELPDIAGEGSGVEMIGRLKMALEQSSKESAIFSRRMFWLSVVLGFLTLVQAIAAAPTIVGWFHPSPSADTSRSQPRSPQ